MFQDVENQSNKKIRLQHYISPLDPQYMRKDFDLGMSKAMSGTNQHKA